MTESFLGGYTAPPVTGLPPERVAEIMLDEFTEIPRSGFPLALQPIVLPRPVDRDLLTATSTLFTLLRKAAMGLADDRAGRMAALGIDGEYCPMFTSDEQFEWAHCADMARADVVIGPDGPKFVEYNVSAAFGGLVHFGLYQRAWRRIREEAGRPGYVAADAYSRYARLIEAGCAELDVPPSAVLIGTPKDWGPDTTNRYFDVQVDLLRQQGVHAVHLDFPDLLDGIGLPGPLRWPLGMAAFTPQDAAEVGYDISPARQAIDAGMTLLPSQSARFLHNKQTLALLSEGLPWMTARDAEVVDRYVPWSRVVGDRKVYWRGEAHELPRLLLDRQEDFVLKGATGWSCLEVFFGVETSPQEWAARVGQAVLDGGFVVQERIRPLSYPLEVMTGPGEVRRILADPVVSPFCLGGAPAGCYVRFVEAGERLAIGGTSAMRTCALAEP